MSNFSIKLVSRSRGPKESISAPRLKSYEALQNWAIRTSDAVIVSGAFGRFFDFSKLNGQSTEATEKFLQRYLRRYGGARNVPTTMSRLPTKAVTGHLFQYLISWAKQNAGAVWSVTKVSQAVREAQAQGQVISKPQMTARSLRSPQTTRESRETVAAGASDR